MCTFTAAIPTARASGTSTASGPRRASPNRSRSTAWRRLAAWTSSPSPITTRSPGPSTSRTLPGTFLVQRRDRHLSRGRLRSAHILVLGVTEAQHRELQRRKRNLYDFRAFARSEGIVHVVAHPLFRVNDRLTLDHLEKVLVLFRLFEGVNGTRDPRATALFDAVLSAADARAPVRARRAPSAWTGRFRSGGRRCATPRPEAATTTGGSTSPPPGRRPLRRSPSPSISPI
jgi:hypothetical protein